MSAAARRFAPGHPIRQVVLLQLPHNLNDRNHLLANRENVPLAAGYLRAMTRAAGLDQAVDVSILEADLADRAGDAALCRVLEERQVDVLGLSLYPWNLARSVALARALRRRRPEVGVVAGGPEVNATTAPALVGHGPVDVAVRGEGEVTFVEVLQALIEQSDLAKVPGVVIRRDGGLLATRPRPPLDELDRIPSPYLDGDIDLAPYRQVPVLFARGCVNACKRCHWWPDPRSAGRFSLDRIGRELGLLRSTPNIQAVVLLDAAMNAGSHFEALCDVLERVNGDRRLELEVRVLLDRIDQHQLERLRACGVRRLEIELQAASPEALARAGRPADIDRLEATLALAEGHELELQAEFTIGLPGDTVATVEQTAALIRQAATRGHLHRVSPSMLSVGSPTRLRAEADDLGLRYQAQPPYRVVGTDALDYASLRDLRRRVPALLGCPPHPCFDLDRRHYNLDFFEPELGCHSWPEPRGPDVAGREGLADGALFDALHLRCDDDADGHAFALALEPLAGRLGRLVQVWLRCDHAEACAGHLSQLLATLSRPNPHALWDVVLETSRAFDPSVLDRVGASIRYEVNNLDRDHYLVNPVEGGGYARLSSRLLLVVRPDQVDPSWLEQVSRRAIVVHALDVASDGFDDLLERALRLPGEGVLVECCERADDDAVRRAIAALAGLDRRVRAFRNLALKALAEKERARRRGARPPRVPYADRTVMVAEPGAPLRTVDLGRRRVRIDSIELGLRLEREGSRPALARRA